MIIIDSITHEWEESEGILDLHGNMPGNSFTNRAKMTPRHNTFVQKILESPCHIISTIRTKTDYPLSEKNGKTVQQSNDIVELRDLLIKYPEYMKRIEPLAIARKEEINA